MPDTHNASRAPWRPQSPPALALEAQADRDAADLDFFAHGAALIGSAGVVVAPAAARRIARTLRSLAVLSRESTA